MESAELLLGLFCFSAAPSREPGKAGKAGDIPHDKIAASGELCEASWLFQAAAGGRNFLLRIDEPAQLFHVFSARTSRKFGAPKGLVIDSCYAPDSGIRKRHDAVT